MKRVFIVHGWDGSPKEPMLIWIKEQLEKEGFDVSSLTMPTPDAPKIETWVPYLAKSVGDLDNQTFLVGHSMGTQTILRYLSNLPENSKYGGAVLIAPFVKIPEKVLAEEGEDSLKIARPWLNTPINWDKINSHTNKFVAIFSDNDPFVKLDQADIFKEKLNAEIIIEHDKGHFDDYSKITSLQSAVDALLKIASN